jgi:DNA recombination protein RmuC
MDNPTIILLSVVVAATILLTFVLRRLFQEIRQLKHEESTPGLLMVQGQLDALREQVRGSLEGGRLEIDRRLEETNRVVKDVSRGLGAVHEQVRSVTKAAGELRGLQDLLRSPNARGGMGEYMLAELLAQVLPQANFSLQYEFSGGERVDAILRIGEGIVPVDSKFPLENFQRMRRASREKDDAALRLASRGFRADVKKHIDAISRRYIRPGEGTYEFAMMYIPAEAVYQEVICQENTDDGLDLFHYALARQVVPVSPQSFYAYLQVIVLGLRGLNVEKRTREILGRLGETRSRLEQFVESFDIAARHLGNAQRQVEEASRRLARLDAAITELSDSEAEGVNTPAC